LFDRRRYRGGQHIEAAALDAIPVFVKGGCGLALNLPVDTDAEGGLGSSVGNAVTGYQNLSFLLCGDSGHTRFEDETGNDFALQWKRGSVTQSGTAVSAYTVCFIGGANG
jgi:alpha-glucosidase (family GH31 glycosyl hydrolase)